jgi:hypothetical protein
MPPTRSAILNLPRLARCAVALLWPLAHALTVPVSATAPPGKDRFEAKLKAGASSGKAGRRAGRIHETRRERLARQKKEASGGSLPAGSTVQEHGRTCFWHLMAANDLAARYDPGIEGVSAAQIRERAARLFADYSHDIWAWTFEKTPFVPSLEALAKVDLVRERLKGGPAGEEPMKRAEDLEKFIILHLQGFAESNTAVMAEAGNDLERQDAARIASVVQAMANARPAGSASALPRSEADAPSAPASPGAGLAQPAMAPQAWADLDEANALAAAYAPRNTRGESLDEVFPNLIQAPSGQALREKTDQLFRQHGKGSDLRSIEPTLRPSVQGIAKCQLASEAIANFRTMLSSSTTELETKLGPVGGAWPDGLAPATIAMVAALLEKSQQGDRAAEEMIDHARYTEGAIISRLRAYARKRSSHPATALDQPVQQFILNLWSAWRSAPAGPAPGEAKAPAGAASRTPGQVAAPAAPGAAVGEAVRYPPLADVFVTCADGMLQAAGDEDRFPPVDACEAEYQRLKRQHLTRLGVKNSPGLESVLRRLANLHAARDWFQSTRALRELHPERFVAEDTPLRFDRVIATTLAIEGDYIALLGLSLDEYVQDRLAGGPIPAEVAGWCKFVQSLVDVELPAWPEQAYWRKPMLHGWPLLPPWVKDEAEAADWVDVLNAEVVKEADYTEEILEDSRAARTPEAGRPPQAEPAAATDPA